jgi:hypothetical protein
MMKFSINPVVQKDPINLSKLVECLKHLAKSDPLV